MRWNSTIKTICTFTAVKIVCIISLSTGSYKITMQVEGEISNCKTVSFLSILQFDGLDFNGFAN